VPAHAGVYDVQKDRHISRDIQRQVLGYYGYLYMQKKLQNNNEFFELLPTIIKVDYCFAANRHVFKHVHSLTYLLPLHAPDARQRLCICRASVCLSV